MVCLYASGFLNCNLRNQLVSFVVIFGSKKDGDNMMNNRDAVNEDRISQLPVALILEVLSLLPTKLAVATSVLSKQWGSLWKILPKLSFESCDYYYRKALLSHKGPVLQSLHLKICSDNAMDTEKMIGIAFARNVRKLVFQVNYMEKFRFPKSLYNCETLDTLELKNSILLDVPASSVCLKSIRTLHLFYVTFKDDESLLNLLSGCPKLENLAVHGNGHVKTFVIAVPSLQRLTIYNNDGRGQNCGYVINAPSLKYLKIDVYTPLELCLIEKVTDLIEADLIVDPRIINENLLESITSVQRLSLKLLSPLEFKFLTGSIFYKLVYLELDTTYEPNWWNLLTLMLDSSPNLQVLKLDGKRGWRKDFLACGKSWNRPEKVPECLSWNLETFVWEFYKWRREGEVEVAKYILTNSNRLKRATFCLRPITRKERDMMVEDLNCGQGFEFMQDSGQMRNMYN